MIDATCAAELTRLIRQRWGIVIQDHQLAHFHRCCNDLMDRFGTSDCVSLCELVREAPSSGSAMRFLIDGITVGESHFFRDRRQMAFLEQRFFPDLIERRRQQGQHFLRVWSAGCSEGQELYSVLLMLHDLLPDRTQWQIELLGTDINGQALQRARAARFHEWSMRGIDDRRRQRDFTRDEGDSWRLRLDLFPAHVRFEYLNLIEEVFPSLATGTVGVDLLLCRNVFIYFSREDVERIFHRFALSLSPDGVLLLGACDPLPEGGPTLRQQQWNEVFHYRREAAAERNEAQDPEAAAVGPLPERQAIGATRVPEEPAAADAVAHNPQALRRLSRSLAGQGRLDEALTLARHALDLDDMSAPGHYLAALLYLESGDTRRAEEALRRTLLLDQGHVLGHYQTGVLKLRQGKAELARKSMQRARRLLEQRPPASLLCEFDRDITCGHLLNLVRHQLDSIDD